MKNLIKFILSFICYLILIPLYLCLTVCATWYLLPSFQTTIIGEWLNGQFPNHTIIITSLVILACTIIFFILSRIFKVVKSSKVNNFYTHLVTWLIALSLIIESLFTFFVSENLSVISFNLTLVRKIGIVSCAVGLLLYSLLAPKFRKLVDRRIQAYDTAKELNANGRSSVVGMQILKSLDFCFPELVLMVVLCFAFNFQIAIYFVYIIVAFIIPIIGNMICDKRVKKEAIRREQEKIDAQINTTAEAVVDILTQRGDNL